MRVAVIDHSYHKTTNSTAFFSEILEQLGPVRHFYDETWCSGSNTWLSEFVETDFDLIVIWQVHEALTALSGRHDNVVFVPMYDAMRIGSRFFWKNEFSSVKSISFCRKLHQEITDRQGLSRYFKYFPDPSQYETTIDFNEIRPFFWYRTSDIDIDLVLELSKSAEIGELTIHNFPDPGQRPLMLSQFPTNVAEYHLTRWFDDPGSYQERLLKSNVFFAPRPLEGIGMSFLEAMACGLCVVAPDAPTMNEYIANGTNGLLYPIDRKAAVDLSRARDFGARARETVERGFADWQRSIPELTDFLATPKSQIPPKSAFVALPAHPRPTKNPGREDVAKVTVVTVCLNAENTLQTTIESVLDQDRANVEYIILDGGSSDGSVQIIKKHADRIAKWRSERDDGVYHAMNKAIDMCTGEWILFMNAGDTFVGPDSLRRMFRFVPDTADVVYGHHFYVPVGKAPEYHPAADFELTWERLQRGDFGFDWLAGIPAHQATAVRRVLLSKLRFDTTFRIAADHDLLFRARKGGARFFNCDELVSFYVGGGLSAQHFETCKAEWAQVATRYGDAMAAREFYSNFGKKTPPRKKARAKGSLAKAHVKQAMPQHQARQMRRIFLGRWMSAIGGLVEAIKPRLSRSTTTDLFRETEYTDGDDASGHVRDKDRSY